MGEPSEAFSVPSITLNVKFGRESLQPALPVTATVKDLKTQLQHLTNVLPRGQKLIFKGKVLDDSSTLKAANLSDGSKIMLMASRGVHQGGGHIKKDAFLPTNSKGLEIKETRKLAVEKSTEKGRLERWRATGIISLCGSGLEGGHIKKDAFLPTNSKGLEIKETRKLAVEKSTEKGRLERWRATGIISLCGSGLEVVPADVWTIGVSTRVLDIGNNYLREVPIEIGNLTNLQKLRLSVNHLSDSGFKWQSLISLKHLTVLALNQNQLAHLPPIIGMLTSLKQLNLAHNKLENLPQEIGHLTQLEILNISNNCLRILPLTIGDCCSLLEVDFSSNLLGELPATLGNLQNMKVLQLANNGLKAFPSAILKGCSQLSTLHLHGNEVTINDLREVEGWAEFDERRRSKHNKQLEFSIMSSSGFDEGADAQQWDRW